MYCICLEMFFVLTMVPTLVLALPVTMLKRAEPHLVKTDDFSPLHYLVQYGHLEDKLDVRSYLRSRKTTTKDPFNPYNDEEIKNAIKSFQTSFNLKPTGHLNEEAMSLMKAPRCGVPDKAGSHPSPALTITVRRRRRFVKQGSKWSSSTITWTIYRYHEQTATLSKAQQKFILENAFKLWEYVSPLKFNYTPNTKQADIVIQFVRGYHGHSLHFDGLGKVLAHAFYPHYGGDIHFDADEKWGTGTNYLLNVAVHEIGHSIGLQHSNVYNSMMFPNYRVRREVVLDDDDKAGIDSIYGECETKLDAAASTSGANYFFRHDLVWKIDEYDLRIMKGYPKHISDEFSNRISTPIDTALVWSDDNIYFLHGSTSLGYDTYSKKVQYDNTIQYDWPGIPNNVDAAIAYRQQSVTYFFKGGLYWKFDDALFEVVIGYPKKIRDGWPGIPDHIDAALYSVWNKKTFFFKGTEYWEFDPNTNRGVPQGAIKSKWKDVCSAKY